MRNNSIIKYTVPLGGCFAITVIIALMMTPVFCEQTVTGILKSSTAAELPKLTSAKEKEYIRENNIESSYSVLITTKNQTRFDLNDDGYLTGDELQEYLRKYR